MSNPTLTRQVRTYVELESTSGTINNTSGTASLAGSAYMRHVELSMDNDVTTIVPKDKTGTFTEDAAIKGREYGKISLKRSWAPNGTPGSVADDDPIMQSLFMQAATVGSGTVSITGATNASPIVLTATAHGVVTGDSVRITAVGGNTAANGAWIATRIDANTFSLIGSTGNAAYTSGGTLSKVRVAYTFADGPPFPTFSLWRFLNPSTANHQVGFGCTAMDFSIELGNNDGAEYTLGAEAQFVLDKLYFSSALTEELGGLTAFPSQPGTHTNNGGIVAGFSGYVVVGGNTITRMRKIGIKYASGTSLVRDDYGRFSAFEVERGNRKITVTPTFYDTDGADMQTLYNAVISKASIDFVITLGTVAGATTIFYIKGVRFDKRAFKDGNDKRFVSEFSESQAFGSSASALDEMAIHIL